MKTRGGERKKEREENERWKKEVGVLWQS
jgi:hypothetical protein